MICLYNNIVFRSLRIGKLDRTKVEFIEFWDGEYDEYMDKYNEKYPNDSVRIYGVREGIPTWILTQAIYKLDDDQEYLYAKKIREREKTIDKLL